MTSAVMKALAKLPLCSSTLEELYLHDCHNSIKEEHVIAVVVQGQRNLRKLRCKLSYQGLDQILSRSNLRDNKSAITHLDCQSDFYDANHMTLPGVRLFATRFLDLVSLTMTIGLSFDCHNISSLPPLLRLRELNVRVKTSTWGTSDDFSQGPNSKYDRNHPQATPAGVKMLVRALDLRYSTLVGRL